MLSNCPVFGRVAAIFILPLYIPDFSLNPTLSVLLFMEGKFKQ
jgi:hypothetical protein